MANAQLFDVLCEPSGCITRYWVVAYGISVGAIAVKVHPQQTSTNADIVKAKAKIQLKSVSVSLLVTVYICRLPVEVIFIPTLDCYYHLGSI